MKNVSFISKITARNLVLVAGLVAMLVGCNKKFDNTLPGSGTETPPVALTRKMLVIVIDGAVGTEVKNALASNSTLYGLTDNSIFSWDGLNNYTNTAISNQLGWATLLTGVNAPKHNVNGANFTGNNFANYPSLFTRIKQEKPGLRSAAFFSTPALADTLAIDATQKQSFADNDAAVKDAAKAELAGQNPSLVLAQFSSVDKAGAANAYSATNAAYKNAIVQVDTYIGEVLAAMRARTSFKDENWMVIITSNKGSNTVYTPVGTPWTAFDDTRHNTIFFCYNPRFKTSNPTRPGSQIPYIGTSPLYSGTMANNRRSKVNTGGNLYDMGATGSFTIQCKVKVPTGSYNYPAFLSKRASFTGGIPGWVLFMEGNYWQINIGQVALGNRQIRGHVISDGQWHTLTVVIKQEGALRNVYTYTDGVLYTTGITDANRNITSYGNLNSPQPLTVGNLPPDNVTGLQNYYVTDVRIYNTDLTGTYIGSNFCKTEIEAGDPYLGQMLGFWPCTEVTADKKMLDKSPNNRPLEIESYTAGSFNELTGSVCPLISEAVYKTVPNGVDLAVQIYQWLGITPPPSWNLDGKNWIPGFSDLGG
ncbi:MAG: DUF4983 domain-containing protein [Bacteroidota bacterium]